MSIGAGIIEGASVGALYGIAPNDDLYVNHTGLTFDGQNSSGSGTVAIYEINNEGDTLDFDVPSVANEWNETLVTLYTVFGAIDFDAQYVSSGDDIIQEKSGYDSDVWRFVVDDPAAQIRLTNFDTNAGVSGQQAAIYPFARFDELN